MQEFPFLGHRATRDALPRQSGRRPRGCACWVLTPHPELPAAGGLTADDLCPLGAGRQSPRSTRDSISPWISGPRPALPCWPSLHPAPLSPCLLRPGWQRVSSELGNWSDASDDRDILGRCRPSHLARFQHPGQQPPCWAEARLISKLSPEHPLRTACFPGAQLS